MKFPRYFLLITHLFIATTSSIAMEVESPKKERASKILATITCVKNPRYAQYLTNNRIVIAGEDGCSIVDPILNTEIKRIYEGEIQHLAIHPNKKLFALSHHNSIDIYNTETDSFIESPSMKTETVHYPMNPNWTFRNYYNRIKCAAFSPHDTTIVITQAVFRNDGDYKKEYIPLCYPITEYNYRTDEASNYDYKFYNICSPIITFNPIQKEICIKHVTDVLFKQDLMSPLAPAPKGFCAERYSYSYCQYSPDGSRFALGDSSQIKTIDTESYLSPNNTNKNFDTIPAIIKETIQNKSAEDHNAFRNIQFYSNSVLATLLDRFCITQLPDNNTSFRHRQNTILCYWDIHTKKLIHTSEPLDISEQYDLSFSPDKSKVVIALKNSCIILPVPFKVTYAHITKKRFSYLLFLLKNYTSQCDTIEIPEDINLLIANMLLETYKRQ